MYYILYPDFGTCLHTCNSVPAVTKVTYFLSSSQQAMSKILPESSLLMVVRYEGSFTASKTEIQEN